jgi:DNA-directed RNA polymerase specialized sigma24 family protein/ribosome-associated translation inhibitor RaiA
MTKMKIRTALRNLDKHGQQRAPEVIAEEGRQLENHLKRFRSELVRLEVVASQTKGKTRIQVRLRLQLPSSVIAAQEEGFEIEPTLRKAFADLRHRVDRHVARLKHESEFKRPARRRRIGAPLPPARDAAEAGRRQLFFGLIEDHLDTVYDAVRRELTYFECSGSVPQGYLSVRDLVDATILKGLERFERRPMRFSVGDWLTQLAFETIGEEARAARRVVPENAASLDAAPEQPAQDPTETDQELFEFHQPDEVLRLEDLVGDGTATDPDRPSTATKRRCACTAHFPHCPRSGDRSSIGPASRTRRRQTRRRLSAYERTRWRPSPRPPAVSCARDCAKRGWRSRSQRMIALTPRSPAQCACPCRSTSAAAWLPP